VETGDVLGTLHTSDAARLDEAEERLREAIHIGDAEVSPPPLFVEV
jgi:thymidine phosphorylase